MAKVGRPTEYTKKLGKSICVRIALGESIRTIVKDDTMPCPKCKSPYWNKARKHKREGR